MWSSILDTLQRDLGEFTQTVVDATKAGADGVSNRTPASSSAAPPPNIPAAPAAATTPSPSRLMCAESSGSESDDLGWGDDDGTDSTNLPREKSGPGLTGRTAHPPSAPPETQPQPNEGAYVYVASQGEQVGQNRQMEELRGEIAEQSREQGAYQAEVCFFFIPNP